MTDKTEYIIVKDLKGNHLGKRKVESKTPCTYKAGFLINGSMIYGFTEYLVMQEEAKDLPIIE